MGIVDEIKTELHDLEQKVEQALQLQPQTPGNPPAPPTETQPQAPSTVTEDAELARLERELSGNPTSFQLQQRILARKTELAKVTP